MSGGILDAAADGRKYDAIETATPSSSVETSAEFWTAAAARVSDMGSAQCEVDDHPHCFKLCAVPVASLTLSEPSTAVHDVPNLSLFGGRSQFGTQRGTKRRGIHHLIVLTIFFELYQRSNACNHSTSLVAVVMFCVFPSVCFLSPFFCLLLVLIHVSCTH